MTAKLVGAGLILAASLALAHRLKAAARDGVAQTEAYLDLLRRIRRQIACYSRPFGEICRRLEPELLAACGFGEGAQGDSFAAMLDGAALCLPAEAERVVRGFAREFGQGYLAEQLALCDNAVAELDAIAEAARRRLPERLKLIRCACLCGGLAVILLLL